MNLRCPSHPTARFKRMGGIGKRYKKRRHACIWIMRATEYPDEKCHENGGLGWSVKILGESKGMYLFKYKNFFFEKDWASKKCFKRIALSLDSSSDEAEGSTGDEESLVNDGEEVEEEMLSDESVSHEKDNYDEYDTLSKDIQRRTFASACKSIANNERLPIIYLETSAGKATEVLVEAGLSIELLRPCNLEPLPSIAEKYAGIQCIQGDIIDVVKKESRIHAVWYDFCCTMHSADEMPLLGNASVCAIVYCARGHAGGAKQLAVTMDDRLKRAGGKIHGAGYAYRGKSGVMNMAFAMATFGVPSVCPERYFHAQIQVPALGRGTVCGYDFASAVFDVKFIKAADGMPGPAQRTTLTLRTIRDFLIH